MKVKSFQEFLNEEEKAEEPAEKSEPKTKDQRLGYTADGKEVMSKMKVGHTIELTPEDFEKIANMRVTQFERDMYDHERGGKEYKISKDSDGKCTIFHYNKTIHELTPIGVFKLNETLEEKKRLEFQHSDAPDAEGRFRTLGIKKLASWLIRTRGRDLKKITGSINQQINFNRRKDPPYAEKMEKVRKEVYRQLGREDLL